MRNLKRTLSLVLAVIMLVGVMAVGAGAAFKDDASITYKDAVYTLANLGVLTGDENGFRPTDNITRAEAAAVIYRFMNGGDSLSGAPASSRFTDVKANEWYAIYVEYCATQGIIVGNGDGTYAPEENITGYAFLKMILTALGYNAEHEGYVGQTWDSAVLIDANNLKLLKGIKAGFDASKAITREEVAQVVYNALPKGVVTYLNVFDMYSHEFNNTPLNSALVEYFDAVMVTDIVTSNDGGVLNSAAAQAAALKGTTTTEDGTVYNTVTDADLLGLEVSFYVSGEPDAKGRYNIIGEMTATDKNVVAETDGVAAYTTGAATTKGTLAKFLKDNGLAIDANTTYCTYTNGVTDSTSFDAVPAGTKAKFIDNNGDGKVEIASLIVKNYASAGAPTTNATTGVTTYTGVVFGNTSATGNPGTATSKNCPTAIAKGDVVLGYVFNGKFVVDVVTPVTGKVTSSTGTTKIVVGGQTIAESALLAGNLFDATDTDMANWIDTTSGKADIYTASYSYYLDDAGNVFLIAPVTATVSKDYAILVDTGYVGDTGIGGTTTYQAKLVYPDGSSEVVTLNTNAAAFATLEQGIDLIYSYTVKDGKYTLTAASDTVNAAVRKGTPTIATGYVSNNKTTFIVRGGQGTTANPYTYAVYTGYANVPSVTSQALQIVASDGINKIVYISSAAATSTATFYVYDTTATYVPATTPYYTLPVIIQGETTTVKVANANNFSVGYYASIAVGTDGIIADSTYSPAATTTIDVSSIDGGIVTIGGAVKTYTESTKVYKISVVEGETVVETVGIETLASATAADITGAYVTYGTTAATADQVAEIYFVVA